MVTAALLYASIAGLFLVAAQHLAVARHLRQRAPEPRSTPGISILKPLCGVDDDLAANLETFARLDYSGYEVLLGIENRSDPAFAVAREAERRWPDRFRVVIRRGTPGANPKVNQLLTLSAAARHDVWVISDSNVRVDRDYLREIAAHLGDASVGLVTHAIAGVGERRIGSLFDNLHLAGGISSGTIAAKSLFGQDIVMGKSMAFRREDLAHLGGFAAVQDVLAEDYVLGTWLGRRLGKRVVIARRPVFNVTRDRNLSHFWGRYQRWAVIQRTMTGRPVHVLQAFLNPLPLALGGLLLAPTGPRLGLVAGCVVFKIAVDAATVRMLRGSGMRLRDLVLVPAKDLLIFGAWAQAFFSSRVNWRGKRMTVLAGTRLARESLLEAGAADLPPPIEKIHRAM